MEQAFETLVEEMKVYTDVLEETFPFYQTQIGLVSSIQSLVRIANITMPCCVRAIFLCKIIKKSVMGESFVFCS